MAIGIKNAMAAHAIVLARCTFRRHRHHHRYSGYLCANSAMTMAALIDSALMAVEWHKDQGCMVSLVIKEMAQHGPSHRALSNWYSTAYESFNSQDARDVHFLTTAMHTTHVTTTMIASDREDRKQGQTLPARARCALFCCSLERQLLRQTAYYSN